LIFSYGMEASALNVTAKSCSAADVQTAVNSVINGGGGAVYIPVGSCTWTSTVSVTTGQTPTIRIIGVGQSSTTITNFGLTVPNPAGTNLIELSNMTLIAGSNSFFSEILRPAARVNLELDFHHLTISGYGTGYGSIAMFEGWYGVFHHNTITCASNEAYGFYIHGDGTFPTTWTYGTRNSLFFENNTFSNCYHSISGFCGAKVVFRYNTVTQSTWTVDFHGPGYDECFFPNTGTPPWRGYPWNTPPIYYAGRVMEHYNNTYDSTCAAGAQMRGGSGISTNNDYQFAYAYGKVPFGVKIDSGGGNVCTGCVHYYTYVYGSGCGGLCQTPYPYWVWNETCASGFTQNESPGCVNTTDNDACAQCNVQGATYNLRAPTVAQDGFTWTPFTYPHPLVTGASATPPSPPAGISVLP
jgi:hypothetical protein